LHLDHLPSLLASLAGSAVGAFVLAVVLDDLLGVALAVKNKAFDVHKLPSFLASQFGTKEAVALLGLVAAAYFAGGDIKQAAYAALAAGGGAMTAAVAADIYSKIKALVIGSPAPVAPAKPTP
jgi:hypothetical protein